MEKVRIRVIARFYLFLFITIICIAFVFGIGFFVASHTLAQQVEYVKSSSRTNCESTWRWEIKKAIKQEPFVVIKWALSSRISLLENRYSRITNDIDLQKELARYLMSYSKMLAKEYEKNGMERKANDAMNAALEWAQIVSPGKYKTVEDF